MLFVLLLASCTGPCAPRSEGRHYAEIGALRAAVAAGDLAEVRDLARTLEDDDARGSLDGPAGAAAERLHGALGFLQTAEDLEDAGDGLAVVAAACGQCHAATHAGVRATTHDTPPAAESTNGVAWADAPLHAWLQNRLWDALVQPDPAAGADAVRRLATHPLHLGDGATARAATDALHALARAPDPDGPPPTQAVLAAWYGRCAPCHAEARPGP